MQRDRNVWDTNAARSYDTPGEGMFSPEVLEPTVRRLAELAAGGRFVIELWVPQLRKLTPGQQAVVFACEPGYIGVDTYDPLNQQVVSHHFRFDDRGSTSLFRSPHRYVWPSELDLIASIAGFALESRHADWNGTEFTADSGSHVSVYRLERE